VNLFALKNFATEVVCSGHPTYDTPLYRGPGCRVVYDMDKAVEASDVIMMLRIQKERGGITFIPSTKEYSNLMVSRLTISRRQRGM
jgi:aspartate carbamoyltransferase catalytic subunit